MSRTTTAYVATTFEEHMRPDVIWFEDPRYAEAFADLSDLDPEHDPVGREIAEHDKRVTRFR